MQTDEAPRTRVVPRLVLHGAPITFRELCERAVPRDTETIVLDLDRTVHLGRNMGELLGWELGARDAYGTDTLARLESARSRGRFCTLWSEPRGLVRYTLAGARNWAVPGLTYFLWGRLASTLALLRRRSFLRYGPEPVRVVQRIPQTALLALLADVSVDELEELARAVWERHVPDQVIFAEDVAWLRTWCPGVKIILSSASPQPTVAVAARALGVDDYAASTVECRDGFLSAPVEGMRGAPRRLASPDDVRINTGSAKIEDLARRHPAALAKGARTVGITDTGYGEDHAWANHFARVIDVNSDTPFVPIVRADSPLEEIHSATVLTHEERRTGTLDPRRKNRPAGEPRVLSADELAARIGPFAREAEDLARAYAVTEHALAEKTAGLRKAARELAERLGQAVSDYNVAAPDARAALLTALAPLRAAEAALGRELARVEQPLSEIAFALTSTLESSRRALVDAPLEALPRGPRAHMRSLNSNRRRRECSLFG